MPSLSCMEGQHKFGMRMRPMQSCPIPPCSPPSPSYWQASGGPLETLIENGQHMPNCMPEDNYGHDGRRIHGQVLNAGREDWPNEVALEDAFIRGLPQLILFKVYSQTSLPLGFDNWKTVTCNLDSLHQAFSEL